MHHSHQACISCRAWRRSSCSSALAGTKCQQIQQERPSAQYQQQQQQQSMGNAHPHYPHHHYPHHLSHLQHQHSLPSMSEEVAAITVPAITTVAQVDGEHHENDGIFDSMFPYIDQNLDSLTTEVIVVQDPRHQTHPSLVATDSIRSTTTQMSSLPSYRSNSGTGSSTNTNINNNNTNKSVPVTHEGNTTSSGSVGSSTTIKV